MTLPSADETLLRRYLLGRVADQSRGKVEERLFTDDRVLWERLCIAEDELVDDYVRGTLSAEESQDFENHFLCTDERRAKVEFARALEAYLERRETRESSWRWLLRPNISPAWAVAAAAMLLLVVQGVGVKSGDSDGRTPGNVVVVASLSPGLTRDVGGELKRVRLSRAIELVRLRLDPGSALYGTYRATVHDVTGDELLSQSKLTLNSTAEGTFIVLSVPTELLAEGDYFVRLQGILPGADPVPLHRYDFRVLRD